MTIVLGSDHAGFLMRKQLSEHLSNVGHEVSEVGSPSEMRFDYPDASDSACCAIIEGRASKGILICGTGIGVSIRANRYSEIRAAVCTSPTMAKFAVEHNHANVVCLGARIVTLTEALAIVDQFIQAFPDVDERHQLRVKKLSAKLPC